MGQIYFGRLGHYSIGIDTDVCTLPENAACTGEDEQLVLVTHPFHPLFLSRLPCVGKRYNRFGERLLLKTDDSLLWSVPPCWTDLVEPHPEILMGQGEALLLFDDLLALSELVEQLSSVGKGSTRRL